MSINELHVPFNRLSVECNLIKIARKVAYINLAFDDILFAEVKFNIRCFMARNGHFEHTFMIMCRAHLNISEQVFLFIHRRVAV